MVVFTCNHCGDSVKKNKVELHAIRCARPLSVSCMDCNKDFDKKTYTAHTQCVTEQEKYSPRGFVARPPSTKGLVKQQEWVSAVTSVIASSKNLPAEDVKLLTIISKYNNIPRKKNKFENFLKNGIFTGSQECVDRVWIILQQKFGEMKSDKTTASTENGNKGEEEEVENTPPKEKKNAGVNDVQKLTKKQKKALKKNAKQEISVNAVENIPAVDNSEGVGQTVKKTKKGKKRKAGTAQELDKSGNLKVEEESRKVDSLPSPSKKSKKDNFGFTVDVIGNTPQSQKSKKKRNSTNVLVNDSRSVNEEDKKFDWNHSIVEVLVSSGSKELPVKVLRKKVLAQYASETHRPITETIKAKFHKRLNRVQGVKALKGRAMLSSTA